MEWWNENIDNEYDEREIIMKKYAESKRTEMRETNVPAKWKEKGKWLWN